MIGNKTEGGRSIPVADRFRKTQLAERIDIGLQTAVAAKDWVKGLRREYQALGLAALVLVPVAVNRMTSIPNYSDELRNQFLSGLKTPGTNEQYANGVYDIDQVRTGPYGKVYDSSDVQPFGHAVEMPLIVTNVRTSQQFFAFGEDANKNGQIDSDEVKFVPAEDAQLEEGTGDGSTINMPVSKQKPQFGTVALDSNDGNIYEVGIIEDNHVDPNE